MQVPEFPRDENTNIIAQRIGHYAQQVDGFGPASEALKLVDEVFELAKKTHDLRTRINAAGEENQRHESAAYRNRASQSCLHDHHVTASLLYEMATLLMYAPQHRNARPDREYVGGTQSSNNTP